MLVVKELQCAVAASFQVYFSLKKRTEKENCVRLDNGSG